MPGRTPLRIGQRGKISRTYLGGGVWEAKCRYRDTDGVTRQVRRRGPPDEYDRYGKLAEGVLIESLAERRPPTDEIGPDTAVMTLVEAHLDRLAEDGRSPATQDTYKLVAGKLRAKLGGVRVAEANPGRIDAVLRAMTNTHGPGMARQAKTILSGALQLAVMANALAANPVRDVAAIKSKRPPKGAPALTVEQLRNLLAGLRTSDYCREYDLADPFTLLIATGLRRGELLGLRWSDYNEAAGTLAVCGKVVRVTGKGLVREDETKTAAGRRTIALPRFAIRCWPRAARCRISASTRRSCSRRRRARGATQQLRSGLAQGPRGARCCRGHHAQLPQERGHPDRRPGLVGAHRRRSAGARSAVNDSGSVHGARQTPYTGG